MRKLIVSHMTESYNRYCPRNNYALILLLSIGMLFFLSGCGALVTHSQPTSSQSHIKQTLTSSSTKAQNTYVLGETFKIGDLQYTLNSLRILNGNTNGTKSPKFGKTFLLLDLTIENHGNADVEVRSMTGFKLYDKDGRKQAFSMSAAQAVKCAMDGTITAGGIMKGELGYEVLEGIQSYKLEIHPNPFSSKTAIIEIPMDYLVFEII